MKNADDGGPIEVFQATAPEHAPPPRRPIDPPSPMQHCTVLYGIGRRRIARFVESAVQKENDGDNARARGYKSQQVAQKHALPIPRAGEAPRRRRRRRRHF